MSIYLDHNATSPLRDDARARWLEVHETLRGNPSSVHAGGRAARAILDNAREQVAAALGAHEEELVFTSGGTESNNLALMGSRPKCLATLGTEHSSVLEPARALARDGAELRLIDVDRTGLPDPASLARALPGCDLVSIGVANNETGATPDLEALRADFEALAPSATLHTDAVQALGRMPIAFDAWGVSLASFSAHKVGGPPGVGVLWKRRGTRLNALFHGGGQEGELRPGTEDAAGIAAAATAIESAVREQEAFVRRTEAGTRALWSELADAIPGVELIGPALDARRLPNTLCVRLPHADGRMLVTRLDLAGVEASAGSACASGSLEPSHVLRAMGYDDDAARAGLRLSLGRTTSRDECKRAAAVLKNLFVASRAT